MEMIERYRLKQDGMVVASVEGPNPNALADIHHYALVYGQDGPVAIEEHRAGRWKALSTPPEPVGREK